MQVERLEQVLRAIKNKAASIGKPKASTVVGYRGVNYALPVHENLNAHHPVGKARFLVDPAKALSSAVAKQIGNQVKAGARLEDALYLGGLRIQRASQQEVPVDTGNLKGSAFTEKENV